MTQPFEGHDSGVKGAASGIPRGSCDTVKLRGVPKASTTAARRKAGCSTRVTTSGMVKT
jgi:hypothetical protein